MKDFRIRIIQPGVPEYRKGLFERLGELYGDNIELWAADTSGMGPACKLRHIRTDYSHKFYRLWGAIRWQMGLSTKGLQHGDVLVICGDMHHLSIIWLAICAKMKSIGVIWWGHHKSATSTLFKIKIRVTFMKILSSVILCYTKQGKDFLIKQGIKGSRIRYTGNTVDEKNIELAIKKWDADRLSRFISEYGLLNKRLILFCSVLRKKTRLEQLFDALTQLQLDDVILVIIGSGEEEIFFKNEAQRLGVNNKILWLGGIVDQNELAPWFLSAKVFVYPGPIGLSLIHSFYYSLPVITHSNMANHGPEFHVMKDRETGYLFEENNTCDLVEKIRLILADEEKRVEMGLRAKQLAQKMFSINSMSKNFSDAIELAHLMSCQKAE